MPRERVRPMGAATGQRTGYDAAGGRVTDRRTIAGVLLSALLMAAVTWAVRAPRGVHAYTSDEVGHFLEGGFVEQFMAEETGVNPPLFRAMTAHAPTAGDRVEKGRAISLESSAVAAFLLVIVGWLTTGRAWAGVFAALPFALVETSVRATAQARAYGLFAAATALFLVALHAWARHPDDRRAIAGVALAAVPLPWIHYMAVPWLLLVGIGVACLDSRWRRLPLWLGVSAVTTLPLVWRVLEAPGRRVPPMERWTDLLDGLFGWQHKAPLIPGWDPPSWLMDGRPSLLTPWVLLAMGIPLLGIRRLDPSVRVQAVAAWTVPCLLVALNTMQAVRPPSLVFLLVVAGPLMAAGPTLLPKAWQGVLVALAVTAGLAWPQVERARRGQDQPYLHPDAVRAMATLIRDDRLPPGDLVVHTRGMSVSFGLYLTGRLPSTLPRDPRCGDDPDCVVIRGRRVFARNAVVPEARWVIDFTFPDHHLPGCVPWPDAPPGAEVFDCAAVLPEEDPAGGQASAE